MQTYNTTQKYYLFIERYYCGDIEYNVVANTLKHYDADIDMIRKHYPFLDLQFEERDFVITEVFDQPYISYSVLVTDDDGNPAYEDAEKGIPKMRYVKIKEPPENNSKFDRWKNRFDKVVTEDDGSDNNKIFVAKGTKCIALPYIFLNCDLIESILEEDMSFHIAQLSFFGEQVRAIEVS